MLQDTILPFYCNNSNKAAKSHIRSGFLFSAREIVLFLVRVVGNVRGETQSRIRISRWTWGKALQSKRTLRRCVDVPLILYQVFHWLVPERSYNIFVGSWNVNQKNPKQVDWKKWLSPPVTANQPSDVNSHSDAEQVHAGLEVTEMKHDEVDIYVISFQEVLTVDNVSPVCILNFDGLIKYRILLLLKFIDLTTGTLNLWITLILAEPRMYVTTCLGLTLSSLFLFSMRRLEVLAYSFSVHLKYVLKLQRKIPT